MCIYIDDYDSTPLNDGSRKARKTHRCSECSRTIDPGETYRYWTSVVEGDLSHMKMCAHCEHTIDLGCEFTGCPPNWYWGMVHDLSPEEGGFVGDILGEHVLPHDQRVRMFATVLGRNDGWRDASGALLPIPLPPLAVRDPDPDCDECDGTGNPGGYRPVLCRCVSDDLVLVG